VDTVGTHDSHQLVAFDPETGIARLQNGKVGQSLGADDGAGVWLLLAMLEAGVEGLYVFHRGEEKGCLGSRWIVENTPELLKGIDAAIAFDRAGTQDIITHQSWGMTASDEFALSLAAQLNRKSLKFRPDDTGVYTDTNEYADIVPECSNVSVGYNLNHGPNETLDVYHLEALRDAVLSLDLDALTIHRQPGEGGWQAYMGSSYHSSMAGAPLGHPRNAKIADLVEVITRCPDAAAVLLYQAGYDADDVRDTAFEARFDDDPFDPDIDLDRAILSDGDREGAAASSEPEYAQ
jgi:hypothetical protein